jgi:hypothetical protein
LTSSARREESRLWHVRCSKSARGLPWAAAPAPDPVRLLLSLSSAGRRRRLALSHNGLFERFLPSPAFFLGPASLLSLASMQRFGSRVVSYALVRQ